MVADTQLDTLEAKGLIRLATYRPELEYLFRHWLVQDAAYGSLLKQERKELHRQVGEALESLYPDRHAELAGMLAIHFEQAGETAKAIEYLLAAGTYGLERSAIQEAFASFDRAAGLMPPASPAAGRRRSTFGPAPRSFALKTASLRTPGSAEAADCLRRSTRSSWRRFAWEIGYWCRGAAR